MRAAQHGKEKKRAGLCLVVIMSHARDDIDDPIPLIINDTVGIVDASAP